jgi:hypothetical protein
MQVNDIHRPNITLPAAGCLLHLFHTGCPQHPISSITCLPQTRTAQTTILSTKLKSLFCWPQGLAVVQAAGHPVGPTGCKAATMSLSSPYGQVETLLQIENMLDMMTLTSGLTTNSYRRVSSGQASSCHSEPKGWGPLRLYLFTLCIALCTTAHSDSHCSSCRSLIRSRHRVLVGPPGSCTTSQAPVPLHLYAHLPLCTSGCQCGQRCSQQRMWSHSQPVQALGRTPQDAEAQDPRQHSQAKLAGADRVCRLVLGVEWGWRKQRWHNRSCQLGYLCAVHWRSAMSTEALNFPSYRNCWVS